MSEETKAKTQKMIYLVARSVDQKALDIVGFSEWLKTKREQLMKTFDARSVTISVFGKAVYVIGVEVLVEEIDKAGFNNWCYKKREQLLERFNTRQAWVVAV